MEATRLAERQRGENNLARVTLSTLTYLRQVRERGALIQILLNSPQVREGLRPDRQARRSSARQAMADRLNDQYGLPRDLAFGATVILTAVCLRAGRLLAEHKIPLEMAERLSLAIITGGNRRMLKARGAEPGG
jgi:hypothetical protein